MRKEVDSTMLSNKISLKHPETRILSEAINVTQKSSDKLSKQQRQKTMGKTLNNGFTLYPTNRKQLNAVLP